MSSRSAIIKLLLQSNIVAQPIIISRPKKIVCFRGTKNPLSATDPGVLLQANKVGQKIPTKWILHILKDETFGYPAKYN